ncbi:MAG: tetratricopeptide repeat protein [Polyangiaceae bacterium]
MIRAAAVAMLVAIAPIQCAHDPDPNARREDTAGDALWSMAMHFETEHDDQAAKETLAYLVQEYPSNRHTEAAKTELAKLGGAPAPTEMPIGGDAGNSG